MVGTSDPVVAAVLAEAVADADGFGLLLTGSRGAGQADADSDYDFAWVLNDPAYQEHAKRGGPQDRVRTVDGHKVELDALGEFYRPCRSVAAWYCWRATDTMLPEG